jgi:hypothetical protein
MAFRKHDGRIARLFTLLSDGVYHTPAECDRLLGCRSGPYISRLRQRGFHVRLDSMYQTGCGTSAYRLVVVPITAVRPAATEAPEPRPTQVKEKCPICDRSKDMQPSAWGRDDALICHNPPCIYVRTLAKSKAIARKEFTCVPRTA